MSHIFVSHATADDETVSKIHDTLELITHEDLWVDHKDILPGDNWQDKIEWALRECGPFFLLVLSRNSVSRPEVTAEWRDALLRNRTVLIAIIDDLPMEDIPARLRILQWVDLHKDCDSGIQALAAAIQGKPLPENAPVTTLRPVTGQIDRRLTTIPLSGRDADVAEIKRLLKDGPVALLGMGGLGKSRMAAEIVLTSEDVGGAIWHTASDISRADEVIELLRDHFNLEATTERKDVLKKLRANKRLIVLDNAESVDAADTRRRDYVRLVDDLQAAGAQVLLTSRVEWDDIQLCQPFTPKPLTIDPAQKIVLDMAKAWGISHDLSARAGEIAEAARLHPRLIEWGVRQMKRFPPDKVIADLRDLKSTAAQAALDEMIVKTLRQMTDHDGDAPAAALHRLNVCRGGFTYEAAEALITPPPSPLPAREAGENKRETDALDSALDSLQTWQFVAFDGTRYRIDPLVVAAVGEDDSAHHPHYDYYYALAWQHDDNEDYLGLDPESANLEAAFEWAMAEGDYEAAYWLYASCRTFFPNRGRFRQRKEWIRRVAKALGNYTDDDLQPTVLNDLGMLYMEHPTGKQRDNIKWAIKAYEAALYYWTPQTVPLDYAKLQNNLGNAYTHLARLELPLHNLSRGIEAYNLALLHYDKDKTPLDYALVCNNLGIAYIQMAEIENQTENLQRAITGFNAALVYWTPEVAPLSHAGGQHNLGNIFRVLAQVENRKANINRAIEAYDVALLYRTPQAAPLEYALTQGNLGLAYEDIGDLSTAITCWHEAEKYFRIVGNRNDADIMLRVIAKAEAKLRGEG